MNRKLDLSLIAVAASALALVACGAPASVSTPTLAATDAPPPPTEAAPIATAQVVATAVPTEAAPDPTAPAVATDAAPAPMASKLNLNTASDDQLLTIPNVGPRMLREFKEYRPYASIGQFRREIGKYVDDATVAAYEQYVFVPIDVNQADAATLQQLPGVDAAAADALIAARPFADRVAFMAKLGEFATGEQLAAAEAMVAP